jgi:hypothetical protein
MASTLRGFWRDTADTAARLFKATFLLVLGRERHHPALGDNAKQRSKA